MSITSSDGYSSIGSYSSDLIRTAWRGVVAHDILMKLLLKTRPYEREKGSADAAYHLSLEEVGAAVSLNGVSHKERMAAIVPAMVRARDRFRKVPADYDRSRPLIGVVGEIFCRQNTFSNFDLIRVVEEQGGECWLADIGEWVWYTDDEQRRRLIDEGRRISKDNAYRFMKGKVMRRDEHALYGSFADDFVGYEEPADVRDVLEMSFPYLPYTGALGEMVLSSGKAIYLYGKGADGIIDISPFTCMNGIVTEAVYPSLQKDLDNMPIRTFYFDGTQGDLERDVGIFIELARTYQRRKKTAAPLPGVLLGVAGPRARRPSGAGPSARRAKEKASRLSPWHLGAGPRSGRPCVEPLRPGEAACGSKGNVPC